jgi:hypothetical protein
MSFGSVNVTTSALKMSRYRITPSLGTLSCHSNTSLGFRGLMNDFHVPRYIMSTACLDES